MTSTTNSEAIQPVSNDGVQSGNIDALKQNVTTIEVPPCQNGVSTPDATPRTAGDGEEGCGAIGGIPTDTSPRSHPAEQAYHVKWINWRGNSTPIITQNENGPCPLIAIINVLLLRGTIHIPQMVEMVSASQLVGYLGDCLLNRSLENASEGVQRNYEQNIHDAMEIITKLSTGLDVNVKFTGILADKPCTKSIKIHQHPMVDFNGFDPEALCEAKVKDFEYTQECVVFDLLNISLCHGWLYDPQNDEIISAVGTCSYNQVVEKIIASKSSKDEEEQHQGLVAEQFLESTAAQLSFYGLCELNSATDEGELCVFFRNNHFSTLIKHNKELCVLVTDQGFLTESSIVWETLSSVEGDSRFVDGEFNARPPSNQMSPVVSANMSPGQQLDADYLVALSLQEDQQQEEISQATGLSQIDEQDAHSKAIAGLSDHELALQLQEQEDLRLAQNLAQEEQQAGQQQAPPQGAQAAAHSQPAPAQPSNAHKEKSCTIL